MNVGQRGASIAMAILLAALGAGCGESNHGPDLIVDLYWDERPDSDAFSGTSCTAAGVDHMEWRLIKNGEEKQVAEGVDSCCRPNEPCGQSIDSVLVSKPVPGNYTLEITGFDALNAPRWSAHCDGLAISRFDVMYRCDVQGPAL